MIAAAVLGLALSLQAIQQVPVRAGGPASNSATVPPPMDSSATAVRAEAAPVIDGKKDDQVWASTPVISQFQEWRPNEGKTPRFKTEAQIAYDASNLYVFVPSSWRATFGRSRPLTSAPPSHN